MMFNSFEIRKDRRVPNILELAPESITQDEADWVTHATLFELAKVIVERME